VLHRWLDCWRGVGDVLTGMKNWTPGLRGRRSVV